MPTVKFNDESESVAGAGTPATSSEVNRVATNLTLADHIGKFVAGEVTHKFVAENLADRLKGKNAIHVSVSWG